MGLCDGTAGVGKCVLYAGVLIDTGNNDGTIVVVGVLVVVGCCVIVMLGFVVCAGFSVDASVGSVDGSQTGMCVLLFVGECVGIAVGLQLGVSVGCEDGCVGCDVG